MKDFEVNLENCLLIHAYSPSQIHYSFVSLLVKVFASCTGGQRINFPEITYYFINRNKPRNIPKYIANY